MTHFPCFLISINIRNVFQTMDVNILRSMVLKFARKKADEAPPPVMKIGINPNLLFRSDTFGLIDMQAPLSKHFFLRETLYLV